MSTSQSRNAPKPLRAASAEDESSERLSQRVLSLHLPESKVQEGSTLRRGVWILGLLAAGAATAYFFIPGKPAQAPGRRFRPRRRRRPIDPPRPRRQVPATSFWSAKVMSSPSTRYSSAQKSAG